MRDLSDNKYLNGADKSKLGMSIFDDVLPIKKVDGNEMLSVVRDFLARLKFNVHTVGYKYLSKLLCIYLVSNTYTERAAISQIAEGYGVSYDLAFDNIKFVFDNNDEFISLASTLLGMPISYPSGVTEALDVLGAIFHIYFPQIDCDCFIMTKRNIDFLQVIDYVRQSNKKN